MHPMTAKVLNSKAGKWVMNKAINTAKGAEKGKSKVNELAWKLKLNPHNTVKEGAAIVAENPIAATGQIAATPVAMAVGSLAGTAGTATAAALPNSLYWIAADKALHAKIPAYANATRAGKKWVLTSPTMDAVLGKAPETTFKTAGPRANKSAYAMRSALADISNATQAAGKILINTTKGL